jgi:hypothetical protein
MTKKGITMKVKGLHKNVEKLYEDQAAGLDFLDMLDPIVGQPSPNDEYIELVLPVMVEVGQTAISIDRAKVRFRLPNMELSNKEGE